MAFQVPVHKYAGKIKNIPIGKEGNQITLGGETAYPFYTFEGEMPNPPKIAMEVYDEVAEDWAPAVLEAIKDVKDDPVAWAKWCVDENNADIVALQLISTDPNGSNSSPDGAAELAKKVGEAIDVPLMVLGVNNVEKDMETLKAVAEKCQGMNLMIGPVTEGNHKQIGAPSIGYGHTVLSSTPIDVNLAKQLNILLGNLGVQDDKMIIDPTTGALGYGMEYSYSVFERIRMAALMQDDDKLSFPFMANVGKEVWKTKEAKMGDEDPKFGDPMKRGIVMECITAATLLLAGAGIVILRHPDSVKYIRQFISELTA